MEYLENSASILLGVGFVLSIWSLYLCWPRKTRVNNLREEPSLGDYKSITARD
jgi:hypothetical protein